MKKLELDCDRARKRL